MELDKLKATLDSILEDLSNMNIALSEAAESLDAACEHIDGAASALCEINEALGEGK